MLNEALKQVRDEAMPVAKEPPWDSHHCSSNLGVQSHCVARDAHTAVTSSSSYTPQRPRSPVPNHDGTKQPDDARYLLLKFISAIFKSAIGAPDCHRRRERPCGAAWA